MSDPAENIRFYLGIDGGGTKTHAVVVDAQGVERGSALVGGANHQAVGVERAIAQVMAATEEAARAAGACLPFDAAWLGLAGIDSPADMALVLPHLAPLAGVLHLTNDADLLLSALPDQIGVALIAGTGAIAVGRNAAGATTRASGWGHLLGDEGSGYDIGRRALTAATRAADGRGEPTLLLARILEAWGLATASDLIGHVYHGAEKGVIAQVAPLALQAARAGDLVARRIVHRAVVELALACVTVGARLGFGDSPLPLALGGSLLLRDSDFRADVLGAISQRRPLGAVALVEQPAHSAARAAVTLAPTSTNPVASQAGEISMSGSIDKMTLDQRIGQLFMVGFTGTEPTPEIIDLIQRWHVGGIILFSRNCRDARQVSRLTHDLQAIAREAGHRAPLLIALDQENGLVRRLGESITNFPGAMALGATGDQDLTYAIARATGQELRALGVNMNLAPDADVNNNPANPVIGVRSFGEDPQLVARLTAAAVRGYRAAGVVSDLKHFPGHGDTAVDSHLGLPSVPHTRERLERIELPPFRAGIAAGADTVMLAHLRLPNLTHAEADDDAPASVSPTVVRLLRETLGFSGVILTDCLEMDAIAATLGVDQGALLALRAGVDLVLISHHSAPQRAAIERARAAVASGELAEETIRQAAQRILALKARTLAWDALPAPVTVDSVSVEPHQRLRDLAYVRSTTLVRDDASLLPAHLPADAQILVVAQPPEGVTKAVDTVYRHDDLVDAIRARHANTRGVVLGADASAEDRDDLLRAAQVADLLIVATINAHLDPRQADLVRSLIATGRPIIGIAACNPYDVAAFPAAPTWLATYEYTQPALAAAAAAIFGAFTPTGRLPVSLASADASAER